MKKLYGHLRRHYSLYSFIANALNAIAMAGFALVGLLNDTMAITWLVGWGIMFAILLGFGKFLDQEMDDLDKVEEHENESTDNNTQE